MFLTKLCKQNGESMGGNNDAKSQITLNSKEKTEEHIDITPPPDLKHPPSSIPLKSLKENYEILEELGNGSFGSVTLVKYKVNPCSNDKNSRKKLFTMMDPQYNSKPECISNSRRQGLVAIKTMLTRLPTLSDYTRVREIKFILAIPASNYLIQIFDLFIDSETYHLNIVMEYMEQNLYQMMRRRKRRVFSIPSLKSILAQVLAGLRHIHEQNFFHRDLKPENILITPSTRYFDKKWLSEGNYPDNYVVKLADFGLARHVENKHPYTAYVSTRWYRSPEILLRSGYYSKPLDIWAFGCVAVEVTIFKPLFPGANEIDQIWKILEVLGTPHHIENIMPANHTPQGGLWEISKTYASKLNLKFPFIVGNSLENFIPSSQLSELLDVIKLCLRWDPNDRAPVYKLCSMPFFRDTVADQALYEKKSKDEHSRFLKNIAEQALFFAGIQSNKNLVNINGNIKLREEIDPNNCDDENKFYSNDNQKNSGTIENKSNNYDKSVEGFREVRKTLSSNSINHTLARWKNQSYSSNSILNQISSNSYKRQKINNESKLSLNEFLQKSSYNTNFDIPNRDTFTDSEFVKHQESKMKRNTTRPDKTIISNTITHNQRGQHDINSEIEHELFGENQSPSNDRRSNSNIFDTMHTETDNEYNHCDVRAHISDEFDDSDINQYAFKNFKGRSEEYSSSVNHFLDNMSLDDFSMEVDNYTTGNIASLNAPISNQSEQKDLSDLPRTGTMGENQNINDEGINISPNDHAFENSLHIIGNVTF